MKPLLEPPAADRPAPEPIDGGLVLPAADLPLRRPQGLKIIGVAAAVAAAGLVGLGVARRSAAAADVKAWTDEQAVPTVALTPVKPADKAADLVLPGQVEAYNSAEVNARASGYLQEWMVDIGSRVKAGDVLAVLDAPELRQQLEQAKADLATAQANAKLAESTNARWSRLVKDDAASRQEAEEKAGDLAAKTALVAAAEANVRRLQETYDFTRIVAPYDGVVTARNAQLGQLVVGGAPANPLFTIADDSKLRIYVRVPQPYIAQLHVGGAAQLTVPEYPGRSFTATLARTSEAVDRASGALTAELTIDNAEHLLKPGEYAQASFAIAPPERAVTLAASALMFRDGGMMVGVVGDHGKVTLRKVSIARDFGATVEIDAGLAASDQVIDNPPDTLIDGQAVRLPDKGPGSAPDPGQAAVSNASHG
jgi:RND family efflux transporter MFP subunit